MLEREIGSDAFPNDYVHPEGREKKPEGCVNPPERERTSGSNDRRE